MKTEPQSLDLLCAVERLNNTVYGNPRYLFPHATLHIILGVNDEQLQNAIKSARLTGTVKETTKKARRGGYVVTSYNVHATLNKLAECVSHMKDTEAPINYDLIAQAAYIS